MKTLTNSSAPKFDRKLAGINLIFYAFIILVSCNNVTNSESYFSAPEYRVTQEVFVKKIPAIDSLNTSFGFRSSSTIGLKSGINTLTMVLYLKEDELVGKDKDFKQMNINVYNHAQKEITNLKRYDKLEFVWMHNGIEVHRSKMPIEK